MISFTQGDTAVLNLTATDGFGNPFNLTAATFVTQILGPIGVIATFENSQHAIVSAVGGTFTLTLASPDTEACGLGANKQILTTVTQGGSVTTFRGVNVLTVYPSVPVQ